MITIRPYQAKDRKRVEASIGALQEHVALLDTLHRIRRLKDFDVKIYFRRTLAKVKKNDGKIFVAMEGSRMVGCIVGFIDKDRTGNLEGYPATDGFIAELIVEDAYRGKGLGALLMKTMETFFRSKGCGCVKAECFGPNDDAHTFYKKLGYSDRSYTLLKIL